MIYGLIIFKDIEIIVYSIYLKIMCYYYICQ